MLNPYLLTGSDEVVEYWSNGFLLNAWMHVLTFFRLSLFERFKSAIRNPKLISRLLYWHLP